MTANNSTNELTLERDQIKVIINALLIGLDSYGEIERLESAAGVLELCKSEVPESLRPLHPTGSAETIGVFAAALRFLQ